MSRRKLQKVDNNKLREINQKQGATVRKQVGDNQEFLKIKNVIGEIKFQ